MSVGINGGVLELSEFLREAKSVSQLLPEIAFCLLMHLCSAEFRAVRQIGVHLPCGWEQDCNVFCECAAV